MAPCPSKGVHRLSPAHHFLFNRIRIDSFPAPRRERGAGRGCGCRLDRRVEPSVGAAARQLSNGGQVLRPLCAWQGPAPTRPRRASRTRASRTAPRYPRCRLHLRPQPHRQRSRRHQPRRRARRPRPRPRRGRRPCRARRGLPPGHPRARLLVVRVRGRRSSQPRRYLPRSRQVPRCRARGARSRSFRVANMSAATLPI
jgi:hypothetical protein